MKLSRFFLFIALVFVLSGCGTSSGNRRYEYPVSKLGSAKQIKAASLDGRFVILDDGSMWNVDWNDANKARRWSSGDRVNVIATHGKSFPYSLMKQASGERVAARYGKKL
ncbi:MAG: hypothetical protein ACI8XO_001601 [Verrucomicrobiales bacterium]|jgi:hypothetical protein